MREPTTFSWRQENFQAVDYARRYWHDGALTVPIDVAHVCRLAGVNLVYQSHPDGFRASLTYTEAGSAQITVNERHYGSRQRYAIAHEIAHYLIDQGALVVRPMPKRIERVCQLFAANLCMPPDLVRSMASRLYGNHDLLADMSVQFGVSLGAMRIQLQALRILPGHDQSDSTPEEQVADTAGLDDCLRADLQAGGINAPDQICYVPVYDVNIDAVYKINAQSQTK